MQKNAEKIASCPNKKCRQAPDQKHIYFVNTQLLFYEREIDSYLIICMVEDFFGKRIHQKTLEFIHRAEAMAFDQYK